MNICWPCPYLEDHRGLCSEGCFQRDNACQSSHDLKLVSFPSEFSAFQQPPQSPDLNLKEHLGMRLVQGDPHYRCVAKKNLPQLCDSVIPIWPKSFMYSIYLNSCQLWRKKNMLGLVKFTFWLYCIWIFKDATFALEKWLKWQTFDCKWTSRLLS